MRGRSPETPEVYLLEYLEDVFGPSTTQMVSRLFYQHQAPRRQLTKGWLNAVAEERRNDPAGIEGISLAARAS